MLSRKVANAPTAFKYLNGVINVFKPAGVKVAQCRNAILGNLCKDLNEMIVREPRRLKMIGSGGAQRAIYTKEIDLSDHVLSVGPRYQIDDIRCACASHLGQTTSGVLVFGINRGARSAIQINTNRPIRVYHIIGRLGAATETHFQDSRITLRATHDHVFIGKLNGLLASMQASHQKKMFELSGVDMQSQAGYELAASGLIRPASREVPLIYGIRCVSFTRPEFTLEVHALNENEAYLGQLVHEIGIEMKSCAHCVAIRCIRQGHFSVEQSLMRRHWTLQGVFANISECKKILDEHPEMLHRTDHKVGTQ